MGRLEFSSGWKDKASVFKDQAVPSAVAAGDFRTMLEDFEKQLIMQSLEKCKWRRTLVCSELGIPRRTLFSKMKKYGLDVHKMG